MSDEKLQPARQQPVEPVAGETAIRGSGWTDAMDAALAFGGVGGGAAGLTTAAVQIKQLMGGNGASNPGNGTPPPAPQGNADQNGGK